MTISFRDDRLEKMLRDRSGRLSPGLLAKRDLERYHLLLTEAKNTLSHFTNNEMSLIYDIAYQLAAEPFRSNFALLHSEVQDEIMKNKIDQKYAVDATKLLDKLGALTLVQTFALMDRAEQARSKV